MLLFRLKKYTTAIIHHKIGNIMLGYQYITEGYLHLFNNPYRETSHIAKNLNGLKIVCITYIGKPAKYCTLLLRYYKKADIEVIFHGHSRLVFRIDYVKHSNDINLNYPKYQYLMPYHTDIQIPSCFIRNPAYRSNNKFTNVMRRISGDRAFIYKFYTFYKDTYTLYISDSNLYIHIGRDNLSILYELFKQKLTIDFNCKKVHVRYMDKSKVFRVPVVESDIIEKFRISTNIDILCRKVLQLERNQKYFISVIEKLKRELLLAKNTANSHGENRLYITN